MLALALNPCANKERARGVIVCNAPLDPCVSLLQVVTVTEQISYEEKRELAKQLQDKQVGCFGGGPPQTAGRSSSQPPTQQCFLLVC